MATCGKNANPAQNFGLEDDLYLTWVGASGTTKMYLTADAPPATGSTTQGITMAAWNEEAPPNFEMRLGTAASLSIPANTDDCPDEDMCGM